MVINLSGAFRRGRRDVSRRVPSAAGEDIPHEDPEQEGVHAQGQLRDHPGQDGGDARQGTTTL